MLYLGVSDNHDSQLKIIQALTRKFKLDPGIRLEDVAALCPFNYTGADFYALCSDAMLKAMTRKAEEIDSTIGESARFRISDFADLSSHSRAQLQTTVLDWHCAHTSVLPR